MSTSAVTRLPMTVEETKEGLVSLGWRRDDDDCFHLGGWLIGNLGPVESRDGHVHTLMEIDADDPSDDSPIRALSDALPTWTPDDGDDYELGWADEEEEDEDEREEEAPR